MAGTMTTVEITVTYSNVRSRTLRNLSVIGKRAYSSDGKSLFDKVTVSTKEEDLLQDFIRTAAQDIISALGRNVSSPVVDDAKATFSVRCDAVQSVVIGHSVIDYCVLATVASYIATYYPQQASPYIQAAHDALNDVVNICHTRDVPVTTSDYSQISTSIQ